MRQYLQSLYPGDSVARDQAVFCIGGQVTSKLRWHWRLNEILADDGGEEKERRDLRHHAIDAVVVAFTNAVALGKFADFFKDRRRKGERYRPPEPWTDAEAFANHVREQVLAINVSHRVRARVRGELHEDTHYSSTHKDDRFSYRKPLTKLKVGEVLRICDDQIRELAKARLRLHKVRIASDAIDDDASDGNDDDDKKGKIPAEVWKEPLRPVKKDGTLRANAAPVKRVRIWRNDSSIHSLRNELPLHCLTTALIPLIEDDGHREVILSRLSERGISIAPTDQLIPASVFVPPILASNRKRIRRVALKEANGVRIPAQTRVLIKPGNLHHVEIYRAARAKGKFDYHVETVSRIEAIRRCRNGIPIVARQLLNCPDASFVMSLCSGEMVEISDKGRKNLYRFETAPTSGQLRFRRHDAAAIERTGFLTKKGRSITDIKAKVTVDLLGRIRDADGSTRSNGPRSSEIDPRIMELARRAFESRGQATVSSGKRKSREQIPGSWRWMRNRLKEMGLAHLGAQLTAAVHHLKQRLETANAPE